MTDSWTGTGPARVTVLSHARALSRAQRYSRAQADSADARFRADLSRRSALWTARSLEPERSRMRGQAVFIETDLAGAFVALDLDMERSGARQAVERIAAAMRAAAEQAGTGAHGAALQIRGADALVFESGELSVAVDFDLPGGFDDGSLVALFSGEARNPVAEAFCREAAALYDDLATSLHAALSTRVVRDSLRGDARAPRDASVRLDSLNILYSGRPAPSSPEGTSRPVLDERLRALIYPTGPEDVVSQSADRSEFVFFGYAFSIVLSERPHERACEAALITRLMHALFNELGAISQEVEAVLASDVPLRLSRIRALKRRVRVKYDRLRSPTFTFRHDMLLFRDHILRQWMIDRSLAHAEHLVDALIAHEQAREASRRRLSGAVMNGLLLVIALLSLVSVAADFRSLFAAS